MVSWSRVHSVARDVILLVLGTAGILHELVVTQAERPVLLGIFAAMLGVPLIAGKRGG